MQSGRVGRWAVAVAAGAVLGTPAYGFYFRGWPAGPSEPPSLLGPRSRTTPAPFAGPPRDFADPPGPTSDPPAVDPPPVPGGGPNPVVPEPGTAVLAAIGLGLLAARRARRRTL